MKNICIITFHCAHNYGAVLQAYALKEYLTRKGCHVFFYDFRPDYLTKKYKTFNSNRFFSYNPCKCWKKLQNELPVIFQRCKKYDLFEKFIDRYLLDNKGNAITPGKLSTYKIDYIILGSDQIWNTQLTKGIEKSYWGDLGMETPCISYAASMECNIKSEYEKYIKERLIKFKAISVREEDLQSLLWNKLNVKSEIVTDPTFLLSELDWIKISQPIKSPSKYILLYYFGYNKSLFDKIEKYAIKAGCELKIISVGVYNDKRYINPISPENFIWLIKNAQMVITNSFHGTAFSIIFRTPFYTLKKEGGNSRIESLCNLANLGNRILDDFNEERVLFQDFDIGNDLNNLINSSKEYLNKAVEL